MEIAPLSAENKPRQMLKVVLHCPTNSLLDGLGSMSANVSYTIYRKSKLQRTSHILMKIIFSYIILASITEARGY